jgi:Uncharacterized protein conserved in bacteria
VYYSVASVWEIAIKHKLKPEQMPMSEETFVDLCERTGFMQLSIGERHIFTIKTLIRSENAPKHNAPFDRMLLTQAKCEDFRLITHDAMLLHYGEDCVMYV